MKTSSYSRRWPYAIFRVCILNSQGLLSSSVNSVVIILDNLAQYRHPVISASTRFLEKNIRQTGIFLIRCYQKYLSPHKGFSCAHRVLYQEESCSQYVKRMLSEQDLRVAIALSRQRFMDCKTAKIILRSETTDQKRRRERGSNGWSCDCFPRISCSPESYLGDCAPDCSLDCFPDCTPDCGDFSPDCGSCDCG